MDDLEQRLTQALERGAQEAPSPAGLADAVRTRARRRRRTRIGVAATAVAVCIAPPAAVIASGGPEDGKAPDPAVSRTDDVAEPRVRDGFRVESWHGVTVEVPDDWGYGDPGSWCAGDGEATDYRVGPPDTLVSALQSLGSADPRQDAQEAPSGPGSPACNPASSYGVTFVSIRGDGPEWPVYPQHSASWPDGAYVGATTVADVAVTVAAEDAAVAQAVLSSARAIGPQGDPNGCTSSRAEPPPVAVPEGAMRLCRYDGDGLLEQSELLTGDDAASAAAARDGSRLYADGLGCRVPEGGVPGVWMQDSDVGVFVDLAGNCPTVRGLGRPRAVSRELLYWALSPGWSGDGTGLPLPPELRQQ